MPAPLSNLQKSDIAREAQRAWLALAPDERLAIIRDHRERAGDPHLSPTAGQRAWRQAQQYEAIGIDSLRHCHQDHYLDLMAWFQNLRPETAGRALKTLLHKDGDPTRRARYILERETKAGGLAWPEYPGAICRRQYKCTLGDAAPRQLWNLIYTVRNRKKKSKETKA